MGRPSRILPLTPHRAKHRVAFQLKRGPKRQKRAKNSLFLKSQLRTIRVKEKRLLKTKKSASKHAPPTSPAERNRPVHCSQVDINPCAGLHIDALTTEEKEESQIYTQDLSHWDNEHYTLRIEEMLIFVKLLNSVCDLHNQHTWIGISGENKLEREVANALMSSKRPTVCFILTV